MIGGTERHDGNPSKAELRAAALAKRDALSDEQRAAAAQALAKRGLPFEITPGMIVSGYSPIRNEIDPVPLMRKLAGAGREAGAAGGEWRAASRWRSAPGRPTTG